MERKYSSQTFTYSSVLCFRLGVVNIILTHQCWNLMEKLHEALLFKKLTEQV